jgi:hypothetical protein
VVKSLLCTSEWRPWVKSSAIIIIIIIIIIIKVFKGKVQKPQ